MQRITTAPIFPSLPKSLPQKYSSTVHEILSRQSKQKFKLRKKLLPVFLDRLSSSLLGWCLVLVCQKQMAPRQGTKSPYFKSFSSDIFDFFFKKVVEKSVISNSGFSTTESATECKTETWKGLLKIYKIIKPFPLTRSSKIQNLFVLYLRMKTPNLGFYVFN